MSSENISAIVERELRVALAPSHLEIVDESAAHAGHAGARSGGAHLAVTIVSAAFEGLPTVARHRLVHKALAAQMGGAVHALALAAHAPSEWDAAAKRPRVSTRP